MGFIEHLNRRRSTYLCNDLYFTEYKNDNNFTLKLQY